MNSKDIKLVIFDLDLTLVDSADIKKYRDTKQWKRVFGMTHTIAPYPGIAELLADLHNSKTRIAVVTSSPDMYCKKIIDHQHWGNFINKRDVIGYHQTARRKPDPEPIQKMLQHVGIAAQHAVHVGDEADDTQAATSAGVFAVGAGWGALDVAKLEQSEPDLLCQSVDDLKKFLQLA